jgi:Transmembrane secretion effector
VVDAWDRRRVMLFTQLMLAAGSAGLAVNAMLGHPRLWPIFACTAEAAAFQGLDWSARRASLRRLIPPEDLAAGLSLQSAALQVTTVVGPAAAGLLIAHVGFGLVYGLDVASFAVAFGSVALLPPLRPERGGQPISLASLLGGLRYLRSSQPLAGVFVIDLGAMVFGLPRALFPALADTVFGGGAATAGYLNAAPGVGADRVAAHRAGQPGAPGRARGGRRRPRVGRGDHRVRPGRLAAGRPGAARGGGRCRRDLGRVPHGDRAASDPGPDAGAGEQPHLCGHPGRPTASMRASRAAHGSADAEAGAAAAIGGPQFAAWTGGLLSAATALLTCWLLPGIWRYDARSHADPALTAAG